MFGQDIFKLAMFIVLIFAWFVFASEAIGETSNYKHKALIESKEDITKPLVALETRYKNYTVTQTFTSVELITKQRIQVILF